MIELRVRWDDDRVVRFSLAGHAGYADIGEDVVCAGVSALAYNALNSCEQLVGVELPAIDEDTLTCVIPELSNPKEDESVQLLVASMVFGIRQIAELYPKHVSVMDENEPAHNRTRV